MNILFISISSLPHLNEHSITLDLIHTFVKNGHNVFIVCASDDNGNPLSQLSDEFGCKVVRVRIGKNKKANIIEKGITTITLPSKYISAIKKYFSSVKFDLVLYPTPPITQVKTVRYIKKRDGAISYLLLKDIFPQNAVDIGMLTKTGIKGIIYKYFRSVEKRLYRSSDYIGCMSCANIEYLLKHNPYITSEKVKVCPNSIEVEDKSISGEERIAVRNKFSIPVGKIVFIYGGNLGRPQDIPFVLKCLKREKNNNRVYFLIVGDGTEYSSIERYLKTNEQTNLKLIQRLPKEEYDELVAACDVGMIFLDHRFTIPNYPSRILGYMQAKIPVLACTDVNTDVRKAIVEGNFGWWCESKSEEDFSDLISHICSCNQHEYGINGFNYLSNHYSTEQSYDTIIEQIHVKDK